MALEDFKSEMERCSQCSYCWYIPLDQIKSRRFSKGCPSVAYNHFNSYSARGRYAVGLSLLKNKCDYTDTVIDIVNKCQSCGACDVACKVCRYNLEPLDAIYELRAKLIEDGKFLAEHLAVIDSLRQEQNMMQQPHNERSKWSEGLNCKAISRGEEAGVVFHAGCNFSYDQSLKETVQKGIALLQKAGVDVAIMGHREICCGARAYSMGYRKVFYAAAKKLVEEWNRARVKTVVTPCADCYYGFKHLYPKIGAEFEIFHMVEYIDRLIKDGRITFSNPVSMTVTYHDPCHLGRLGEPYIPWKGVEKKIRKQVVVYEPKRPRKNGAWGVYDSPRDILKGIPGLKLVEMERVREYAWCCGAGGGVREAFPDFSEWTASERIEEANSVGAEAIVTACPWCEINFMNAADAMKKKIKVFDIVDMVSQSI